MDGDSFMSGSVGESIVTVEQQSIRIDRDGLDYDIMPSGDITHDRLFKLLNQWTSGSEEEKNSRYYFRGENEFNYHLQPSLLRSSNYERLSKKYATNDPIELEASLIQRFKRYTSHIYHQNSDFSGRNFSDLEMLCLAQHNGLPTLLLDFTLNPLVAIYFAVRSHQYEDIASSDKKDAALWVMKLKNKSQREKQTIHLEDAQGEWIVNFKDYRRSRPLLVVPLAFTHRISAQAGRFVYAGFLKPIDEAKRKAQEQTDVESVLKPHGGTGGNGQEREKVEKPWDSLEKWRIPSGETERRDLLRTLRFLGVHEGTLLTDLDGWAKYLKDGNL